MNEKTIINYLENYLEDLEYWQGNAGDVSDVNYHTSGTPCFDNLDEVEKYIKPLQDFLKKEEN
jgi:hypothetical protein